MQFTLIGRTVNLATRVQTLTRQYEVDILVTRAVLDHLDPRFRLHELPATEVRGIAELVAIYAAVDFNEGMLGSAPSSHSV